MSANSNNQIADDLLAYLRSSGPSVSSSRSTSVSVSTGFLSQIELAILRSINPIEIEEAEEINVLGNRGIWINKAEVLNWRGDLALSEYAVNEDANPEVIIKKVAEQIEYVQELVVRYLKPPTPPVPGEIIITMEANMATEPAPPLIIRQQPARSGSPEPLVIREAPPQPPMPVGPKKITISGKRLPPPPRKVVIERLAPLPIKPQNVIIERWLPYGEVKRRVIFNRSTQLDPVVAKPRNVIIQWEAPEVNIKKEVKFLGVIRANPAEYVQRYGASLKVTRDLPQFVLDINTFDNFVLAADHKQSSVFELEGQLEGLAYVDLEKEGLSEYRAQLERLGIRYNGGLIQESSSDNVRSESTATTSSAAAAEQIFSMIDTDNSGFISVEETGRILLRINSRLSRNYGEDNINSFFRILDKNGDGKLNLEEFKTVFENLRNA